MEHHDYFPNPILWVELSKIFHFTIIFFSAILVLKNILYISKDIFTRNTNQTWINNPYRKITC